MEYTGTIFLMRQAEHMKKVIIRCNPSLTDAMLRASPLATCALKTPTHVVKEAFNFPQILNRSRRVFAEYAAGRSSRVASRIIVLQKS